jgi:hypothetical protein
VRAKPWNGEQSSAPASGSSAHQVEEDSDGSSTPERSVAQSTAMSHRIRLKKPVTLKQKYIRMVQLDTAYPALLVNLLNLNIYK